MTSTSLAYFSVAFVNDNVVIIADEIKAYMLNVEADCSLN
jgi:hypothetical protein